MIEFRQKEFVGLQDGFGGKLGRIKRSGKKSDSYKNFGPWEVSLCDSAKDEYMELNDKDMDRVDKIMKEIETKPYQGNYEQHSLWEFYDADNECVVWSAKINNKDRLTYLIFKFQNIILVTNLVGHNVINIPYAERPNIWDDSKKKKR
jgi:Txe/YoeB family toxin of Txe-Axe toxin-antitoxin module